MIGGLVFDLLAANLQSYHAVQSGGTTVGVS
jgi:hypothetical protein